MSSIRYFVPNGPPCVGLKKPPFLLTIGAEDVMMEMRGCNSSLEERLQMQSN